jgi:hypothetical protein
MCPAPGTPQYFDDVSGEVDTATRCLVTQNVVNPAQNRRYNPTVELPRWQMALFLHRLGGKQPAPTECGFTDMAGYNAEVNEAACWLKAENITTGVNAGATLYGPTRLVNRSQMALFLWRTGASLGMWTQP